MPTVRMWCASDQSYVVTGKLIKDTGTGIVIENETGLRFFAPNHHVISRTDEPDVARDDLFAPL